MPIDDAVILHGNDPFTVEVRGFDHIPEAERNMTPRQVDLFWVANSVNLLGFALGALAAAEGLGLAWVLTACMVGGLLYAYVAFGSIVAVRAGLPVNTLTRAVFGMRGNLPNAALAWLSSVAFEVINIIFGVEALLALFQWLGWSNPGATGKLLAVGVQLLLCGGIAVWGHATMIWFQRIFAVLVSAALLIVFVYMIGKIDFGKAAASHALLSPGATLAAFMTACAIIASNPLSFLFNGPDWVRYLPSATPAKTIFWHVFLASYIPGLALTLMGALCATLGDMSDPVAGLRPFIPSWLFVIYILAVIGGSIANSVPTYYSSGLTLQAMGLRLHRHVATALDVTFATALALYVIFVQDFTTALNAFIALLMVWVGPFGGVWICDGLLRRGRFDTLAIHSADGAAGRYWGWHGLNPSGCIALLAGMLVAALTMRSPLYDGPFARALGGADLSWVLGFPVSVVVYAGLARLNPRRVESLGACRAEIHSMSRASEVRQQIWGKLRAVAKPDSRFHLNFAEYIPDFIGSELATDRLVAQSFYARGGYAFVTPDNGLADLRRRMLDDGKTLVVSTYGIHRGFVLLDPSTLAPGESLYASWLDGLEHFGRPVTLAELAGRGPFDFMVTGASAVSLNGVRFGKGHGFFDLEWGMFTDVGIAGEATAVSAVVHDVQVVEENLTASTTDILVDYIATPTRFIVTARGARPHGIQWDVLKPEQLAATPPLQELRAMQGSSAAAGP